MVVERKGIKSNEIVVIGRTVEEYYFMLALIVIVQHFYRRERAKNKKITYENILQKVRKEWGLIWISPNYWRTHKPK